MVGTGAQLPPGPVAPAVHGACPGRRATRPSPASPRARRSTPSVSGRSAARGLLASAFDWVAGAVGWAEASRPVWDTRAAREDWYGRSGWSPPSSAGRTLPQFGMWDAMFVWYLLNTLSQPGHADFFHHHATDPGYAAWRAEADRLAATDPSVRQKLAELDTRLAAMQEKPRAKDYLPPNTPPALLWPPTGRQTTRDGGWGSFCSWCSSVWLSGSPGAGWVLVDARARQEEQAISLLVHPIGRIGSALA